MNPAELSEEPVPRVPTGARGLDVILRGGWLHGGTYMVTGTPGTGKTILGNQLCFSHVARGGRAVYVTVLAESHGRMMLHLRPMCFFRRDVIGKSLHYVSGYATLKAEGLEGLGRLLYRAVREHEADVLVVDGLLAVEESAESRLAFREFLHGLGVHNALTGCATLLLTALPEDSADPQYAMVDGVVVLRTQFIGLKAVRSLEVMKLRGSPYLTGRHLFEVSTEGLIVHPRLEALTPHSPEVVPDVGQRMGFGLPRLDEMVGGGLPTYSSTLVFGSPGSGKTLLGLHFLAAGARKEEPGLYYGFMETPLQLQRKAAGVGLELQPSVDNGRLLLRNRSPVEALPDALAREVLELVEQHQVKRLVLDGLEPFIHEALPPQRMPDFLIALATELRARRVTSMMTQQLHALVGPELRTPLKGVEAILDNLLLLRYVELRSQLYRMLSILKMRESDYAAALRQFAITPQGIDVAETFESAVAILTGQARPAAPKPRKPPKPGGPRLPPRRRSRA